MWIELYKYLNSNSCLPNTARWVVGWADKMHPIIKCPKYGTCVTVLADACFYLYGQPRLGKGIDSPCSCGRFYMTQGQSDQPFWYVVRAERGMSLRATL